MFIEKFVVIRIIYIRPMIIGINDFLSPYGRMFTNTFISYDIDTGFHVDILNL